jgi:hypothetical protein
VSSNILNKEIWIAAVVYYPAWKLGRWLKTPHHKICRLIANVTQSIQLGRPLQVQQQPFGCHKVEFLEKLSCC